MVQPGVSALGKKKSTTGFPRKSFRLTGWPSWSGTLVSGTLSPISMNDYSFAYHSAYLYRKRVISRRRRVTILLVISLFSVSVPATAQSKKPGGPRAIGVVTWNGD